MIVSISRVEGDDEAFLVALDGLIAGLVGECSPELVHIVRIDNWFDHKWLGFSGRGRVAFPYGEPYVDTALDEFRQQKLTFPPFSPSRVVAEHSFDRISHSRYALPAAPRVIHGKKRAHSARNLQRRVADFADSALFLWFSSNSARSRHASLMVYTVQEGSTSSWFASFAGTERWGLHRVKGISREQLRTRFPLESGAG